MPQIFRAMLKENNAPKVGDQRDMLGVRVPIDIQPNENGMVSPGTGGLSVNPDWKKLPAHVIPKKYNRIVPRARGKSEMAIWVHGAGTFESSIINENLELRVDSSTHGMIEPRQTVNINEFQTHLMDTRSNWNEVEL